MIAAALGAIHGNVAALNAALDAIEDEGIQTIVCTGNLLGPESDSVAIVDRLDLQGVTSVQGLWDKRVARYVRKRKRLERELSDGDFERLGAIHDRCRSADIERLSGLSSQAHVAVDGVQIFLCGAGHEEAGRGLHGGGDSATRRLRESTPAAVFVLGGSGEPASQSIDGALFVDPGTLLGDDGQARFTICSTEDDTPVAEHRKVPIG